MDLPRLTYGNSVYLPEDEENDLFSALRPQPLARGHRHLRSVRALEDSLTKSPRNALAPTLFVSAG